MSVCGYCRISQDVKASNTYAYIPQKKNYINSMSVIPVIKNLNDDFFSVPLYTEHFPCYCNMPQLASSFDKIVKNQIWNFYSNLF